MRIFLFMPPVNTPPKNHQARPCVGRENASLAGKNAKKLAKNDAFSNNLFTNIAAFCGKNKIGNDSSALFRGVTTQTLMPISQSAPYSRKYMRRTCVIFVLLSS